MQKKSADRNRAIVMGASMAGLVTARALSDHYRELILVEQDRFENVVEHRRAFHKADMPMACWRAARTH
jgi:predicted oxidoreductase